MKSCGIDTTNTINDMLSYFYDEKEHEPDFIIRYITDKGSWKGLRPYELKMFRDKHIYLVLAFETNPTNANYFTRYQGLIDVENYRKNLQRLGLDSSICVYFTVDFDCDEKQIGFVKRYFESIAQSMGTLPWGVYGSQYVIDTISNIHHCKKWRSLSKGWKGYDENTINNLNQEAGDDYYDVDYSNGDAGGIIP